MGLVAVFWFRYRDRQMSRKELMKHQQGYPSEGRWGGDSENGMVAAVRSGSGSAADATRMSGASAVASTGTGIARLATESSPPMTSYRHEAFMALVKEAAMGFYAPGLDQPPATTGSLSAESPASTAIDNHRPLTNGSRGGEVEGEESVHRQEESSQGPSDDGSVGELQYLDVGSPRLPRRIPT